MPAKTNGTMNNDTTDAASAVNNAPSSGKQVSRQIGGKMMNMRKGGKQLSGRGGGKRLGGLVAAKSVAPKRKRKCKPGVKALKEIRNLQRSVDLIIPKAAFARCVNDVLRELANANNMSTFPNGIRITKAARLELQELIELDKVKYLEIVNQAAIHRKCITVKYTDYRFVCNTLSHYGIMDSV